MARPGLGLDSHPWFANYTHSNPMVCATILEQKHKKMEAENKEMREKLEKIEQVFKEGEAHGI